MRCGFKWLIQCKRAGEVQKSNTRPNQSTCKCNCPWQLWTEEVKNEDGDVVWVVSKIAAPAVKFADENGIDRFFHNQL
jgi:hypothetical protein